MSSNKQKLAQLELLLEEVNSSLKEASKRAAPSEEEKGEFKCHLNKWIKEADSEEKAFREIAAQRIFANYESKFFVLDLSCLKLTSLPSALERLSHLNELILNHNLLSEIPTQLFSLPKLVTLEAKHNRITQISDQIGTSFLRDLVLPGHIDLEGNQLKYLPPEIFDLPPSFTVNISQNDFSSLVLDHLVQLTDCESYQGPRFLQCA